MKARIYAAQVNLLLQVLPEVARESCFALYGGTAINLFIRELPRLSVDIDLIYIPIEAREKSLQQMNAALRRIKTRVEGILSNVKIFHRSEQCKLQISIPGAQVKIEVNQVGRGTLETPITMPLCQTAQMTFDAFCEIKIMPIGQLYGGKICAALDRQHPRDLFDIKYFLDNEGFSEAVKTGFLLGLLSSDRPLHEMLNPHLQDQRLVMANHFDGMSEVAFSYRDFEQTRVQLLDEIRNSLSERDKAFLLSVSKLSPDWSVYNFASFPAVRWKLQNLQKLKDNDPDKYREQYLAILKVLGK